MVQHRFCICESPPAGVWLVSLSCSESVDDQVKYNDLEQQNWEMEEHVG